MLRYINTTVQLGPLVGRHGRVGFSSCPCFLSSIICRHYTRSLVVLAINHHRYSNSLCLALCFLCSLPRRLPTPLSLPTLPTYLKALHPHLPVCLLACLSLWLVLLLTVIVSTFLLYFIFLPPSRSRNLSPSRLTPRFLHISSSGYTFPLSLSLSTLPSFLLYLVRQGYTQELSYYLRRK